MNPLDLKVVEVPVLSAVIVDIDSLLTIILV